AYGVGTQSSVLNSLLHGQSVATPESHGQVYKPGARTTANENLTLYGNETRHFGPVNQGSGIKRSQGMFRHPAIAAGFCGLILPIVLTYIIAARNNRDRILLLIAFASGITALLLTFSRAGM